MRREPDSYTIIKARAPRAIPTALGKRKKEKDQDQDSLSRHEPTNRRRRCLCTAWSGQNTKRLSRLSTGSYPKLLSRTLISQDAILCFLLVQPRPLAGARVDGLWFLEQQ